MADREQVNIRLGEDEKTRLEAIRAAASEATGLKLNNADLFRMGLAELEKKYLRPPSKKGKR